MQRARSREENLPLRRTRRTQKVSGTIHHGGIVAVVVQEEPAPVAPGEPAAWARRREHPCSSSIGSETPAIWAPIARTAAFFGVPRIVIPDDPAAARPNDAAFRVAEGGLESVEVRTASSLPAFLRELASAGYAVLGASPRGGSGGSPRRSEKPANASPAPVAIVLGNEEQGLSPGSVGGVHPARHPIRRRECRISERIGCGRRAVSWFGSSYRRADRASPSNFSQPLGGPSVIARNSGCQPPPTLSLFHLTHSEPIRTNVLVFVALLALLFATVGAAYLPMGSLHFPVAMLIAAAKAVLIVLFFMHALYSNRLTLVVSVAALLWLGIMSR